MSQDPDTKDYILILQDSYCEKCGKGGFATVNLAMWIDGPLKYGKKKMGWERMPNKKVALKSLHNTQNITSEFLNEVKAYSYSYSNPIDNIPQNDDGILKIYGITQNPSTKDYVIILQYAGEGNLYNYKDISKNWYWAERLYILRIIIKGLEKIHKTQMVHRDFHIGNILMLSEYALTTLHSVNKVCISDMGLCGEIGNMDETKIYGVMPYMAPEVLRATGRQPFDDRAHDEILALNICNGTRPEIDDQGVPEFYIDVMKKCWDSNPENRPTASEIEKSINVYNPESGKEIMKQNNKADEYRKANLLSIRNATHPQAYYTSRLLNPFTKDLPKYDTECLECAIDD
ncbi:kinase-like domain-containing protein [Rhizophagus clarus]|uniref:Kinase-like domain-containing protein n=1 Tax=Rhizophagus clarus TaxID=94130 RepID=A0A8H3KVX0_9GLOM|nr:kinase-like domain-containing protein [Rhizophagus clarus]